MKVRDLMTTEPITTTPDTPLKEAARLMVKHKVSGLPVVRDGKVVGMVTEGDFLRQEANRDQPYRFGLLDALFGDEPAPPPSAETVGEVMTEPVLTVTPEASLSEAARIMSSRRVKRLPVVAPNGSLVGVISRADVVNAFTKPDDVIEDEIREDIVRRLLFLEPDALDVRVRDGVVMLSGRLENRTEAHLLEELTRRLDGVIRVESSLTYEVDDHRIEKMYPLS
jgi:CBS domain-containing protein